MDSITQAALGAAIGEALLGKKIGNKGALLGAIIATIPDLDVLLYLVYTPLEMLSIHRGLSHSIFFSVLAALVIALLLKRMKWTQQISFPILLFFAWLVWFTHEILDAYTAYGTQLLMPFSDARIGFDSINVVDPVYTLPLMIGLILSLTVFKIKKSRKWPNSLGLILSSLYLFSTLGFKQQIEEKLIAELASEQVDATELLTMPVGVGSLNWYGVAKTDDRIYLKRLTLYGEEDSPFASFPINAHLLDSLEPELAEKMIWFSKGFYTVVKEENGIRFFNLQVDMRGIIEEAGILYPTAGYFRFNTDERGMWKFGSGTVRQD